MEDRCRNIIACLDEYKITVLNGLSVKTQNPSDIIKISSILRNKLSEIKDFIERRIEPANADAHMKACLQCLEKNLPVGDYEIGILTSYWCKRLFEDYDITGPMVREELLKNSLYQGEDEQEQEQEQQEDQVSNSQ